MLEKLTIKEVLATGACPSICLDNFSYTILVTIGNKKGTLKGCSIENYGENTF